MPFNPKIVSPAGDDWTGGELVGQPEAFPSAELGELATQLAADANWLEKAYPAPALPDTAELTRRSRRRFRWWYVSAAAAILLLVGGFGIHSVWQMQLLGHFATVQTADPDGSHLRIAPDAASAVADRGGSPAETGTPVEDLVNSELMLLHYMEMDASVRDAFDDLEQDGKLKRVPISL